MKIPDSFENIKVLVIGDVMVDRYWWGDVNRISPEAPVPVVKLNRASVAAGGAANVAANIAGLGATPYLVGCIGDDLDAELVPDVLSAAAISDEHLIRVQGRATTVKTRIIAHSQQVTRVDQETSDPLDEHDVLILLEKISSLIEIVDIVVISDYAKGLLSKRVLKDTISIANQKNRLVMIDPKGKDFRKYIGADLLTPNRIEAAEAAGLGHGEDVSSVGKKLLDDVGVGGLLITQGSDGMTLFADDREPVHFGASARSVYDVTGAGDTVIATLAACIAAGADFERAAFIANVAAGVVVEQVGTTPITAAHLQLALSPA